MLYKNSDVIYFSLWSNFSLRILAVDPGEKRLGISVSDPTGTIANPLTVLKHESRARDVATIIQLAIQQDAEKIVVGLALDTEGIPTQQGQKAKRLAEALQAQSHLEVILWDESESTKMAREARMTMGVTRKKRRGHLDDLAATVILQSFLDAHKFNS